MSERSSLAVAGAIAVLLVAGIAPAARGAAADAAHGKALAPTCLACHGVPGFKVGDAPVPRIAKQQERYLVRALEDYRHGQRHDGGMRALAASLDAQATRDIAAYLADERPNDDAAAIRALGARSETTGVPARVVEVCGSCHGETGGGILPEIPTLAGQRADYLEHVLTQYKAGARHSPVMQPLARSLSGAQISELAAYFSAQALRPFSVQDAVLRAPAAGDSATALSAPGDDARPDDAGKTTSQILIGLRMVVIPGGNYVMGDDASQGFNVGSPKHTVHIRPFRMGQTEVTFEQYDAFARETHRPLPDDAGWGRAERPVINITWTDTQAFIAWLNQRTGRHFRLPSESEWEYAARGGTTTTYWWGDDFRTDYLNARGTNARDHWLYTAPAGQFPANPYGLFDTSGNVAERVADCWHASYDGAPDDGRPWITAHCYTRVSRGGSWNLAKRPMQSTSRGGAADSITSTALGFRLAEDPR